MLYDYTEVSMNIKRLIVDLDNTISYTVKGDYVNSKPIEQTINIALQQAEAMRQSILKDAFEGRL